MRNVLVPLLAAAAVAVAGCATDSPAAAPPSSTTPPAGTFTDATGALPADSDPKTAEAGPRAALTVTEIRLGKQPGFDRVVYQFGGTGTPGWDVRYVDQAVRDGSGRTVDVAGSILEVRILGAVYPFDTTEVPYAGPDPTTDPGVPEITGVYKPLVFEGVAQSFIGVRGDRPAFTVSSLTGPTRLVVDIATG
ncbi:AMIN-like domain-containing (lipo)protein [Nocardia thailandica]|uniref:AMIN-like domain-containing (lipo)protein n=1 Tax=Nocardia thailandica TaxID=257275 RepID=UPI0005B862ED|nr:hypothetical protein [Nocardia thailandica]